MVALKAGAAQAFLKSPKPDAGIILIYGPDRGLVQERFKKLLDHFSHDSDDPFATVHLDAATLSREPMHLVEEASTVSIFGGLRIITVRHIEGQDISKAVKAVLQIAPVEAVILLQAGDLKPTSALRKLVEKDKTAVALPSYQDTQATLTAILDEELQLANLQMDPGARKLLFSFLGADRQASRNEIQKLCLYALEKGSITETDIIDVIGDASAIMSDDVIDATVTGDLKALETGYVRLVANGQNPSVLLSSALRHLQTLIKARIEMSGGRSADEVIGTLRPPIFFKRKAIVSRQLVMWQLDGLKQAANRLHEAVLSTRQNPLLDESLALNALLTVARAARARQRR